MSKYNKPGVKPSVASPIKSKATAASRTHEGAPGYSRDAKSELFLLAVSSFVGEDKFYESAKAGDDRFSSLARQVGVADGDWMLRFVTWLRNEANIRSGAIVAAAEAVKGRLETGTSGMNRSIIRAAIRRPDEPGEMLAYWTSKYGRNIPQPVKRGVADAARDIYNERALLKYDTDSKGFRFGDVIELTHPSPAADKPWQNALFRYAIDRRQGRGQGIPGNLRTLWGNRVLRDAAQSTPSVLLNAEALREAGMTWEDVLSLAGSNLDKKELWESVIPSMGYMALLRNLRNFDQAGVSNEVADQVAAKLSDPDEVARSRQFPMRFLSAYRAAPSLRWSFALEKALGYSLANVPVLKGRTLILVDTSGSMGAPFSKDGTLMRWDAAAAFGIALGQRCEDADVVSFSDSYWGTDPTKQFPLIAGESLLKSLDRWKNGGYFLSGGTDTAGAVQAHYRNHDRVVVLTDEQASWHGGDVFAPVPANRMAYTWNLAGYRYGHAESGTATRHTFGGLTDQAFKMIDLIERGRNADWPF